VFAPGAGRPAGRRCERLALHAAAHRPRRSRRGELLAAGTHRSCGRRLRSEGPAARWAAKRELSQHNDGVDVARIQCLIDDARAGVEKSAQVRRCHDMARKGIDEASSHLDDLVRDVRSTLDSLLVEVDEVDTEDNAV
jgi:hypothetical protein